MLFSSSHVEMESEYESSSTSASLIALASLMAALPAHLIPFGIVAFIILHGENAMVSSVKGLSCVCRYFISASILLPSHGHHLPAWDVVSAGWALFPLAGKPAAAGANGVLLAAFEVAVAEASRAFRDNVAMLQTDLSRQEIELSAPTRTRGRSRVATGESWALLSTNARRSFDGRRRQMTPWHNCMQNEFSRR